MEVQRKIGRVGTRMVLVRRLVVCTSHPIWITTRFVALIRIVVQLQPQTHRGSKEVLPKTEIK